MNLLLLFHENMQSATQAMVSGRQLAHVNTTLNVNVGDTLCVGLVNQKIGTAKITSLNQDSASLLIEWHTEPPAALPLTLIIALPRPKMLKRIIQSATTMGVKQLYFINSWKVEKSFWHSPWLTAEKLQDNCILGLEQGRDTVLPEIYLKKGFKPFVEDELPQLSQNSRKIVAHPGAEHSCPINIKDPTTLIVGPEGGFTPYEIGKFEACGFQTVHLGSRILRVETAVVTLLARLFCS